jgi:hypothetical protein
MVVPDALPMTMDEADMEMSEMDDTSEMPAMEGDEPMPMDEMH